MKLLWRHLPHNLQQTSTNRRTSNISNNKSTFWNNIFKGVWADPSNSQNIWIQQIRLIDAKMFKEDANVENDVDFQENRIIIGLQSSSFYPLKPFSADNFLKVLSSNLPDQPSVVEIQQPAEMNQPTKALLEHSDDTILIYAHIFYTFKRCIDAEERTWWPKPVNLNAVHQKGRAKAAAILYIELYLLLILGNSLEITQNVNKNDLHQGESEKKSDNSVQPRKTIQIKTQSDMERLLNVAEKAIVYKNTYLNIRILAHPTGKNEANQGYFCIVSFQLISFMDSDGTTYSSCNTKGCEREQIRIESNVCPPIYLMTLDEVISELNLKIDNMPGTDMERQLKSSKPGLQLDEVNKSLERIGMLNANEFKKVLDETLKINDKGEIILDIAKIQEIKNQQAVDDVQVKLKQSAAKRIESVFKIGQSGNIGPEMINTKQTIEQIELAKATTLLYLELVVICRRNLDRAISVIKTLQVHRKSNNMAYSMFVERYVQLEENARRALQFKRVYLLLASQANETKHEVLPEENDNSKDLEKKNSTAFHASHQNLSTDQKVTAPFTGASTYIYCAMEKAVSFTRFCVDYLCGRDLSSKS
ncbi:hypothetical protein Ddc_06080 [Ditylenchus destructor]|nr:hypothetical protein Ddc_06080 [Ditylenchus destructor]